MAAKPLLRSVILAGLLLVLTGPSTLLHAAKAAPASRAKKHEFRHEIDKMEESWRSAMLQNNSSAMEALLADDYTSITAKGAIETKEEAVTSLRSGAYRISTLSISDRKVRIYGSTAVVTSLAELTGTRDTEELTGRYRYTRVYVRNQNGQWKIVSFEVSRIQESTEHR